MSWPNIFMIIASLKNPLSSLQSSNTPLESFECKVFWKVWILSFTLSWKSILKNLAQIQSNLNIAYMQSLSCHLNRTTQLYIRFDAFTNIRFALSTYSVSNDSLHIDKCIKSHPVVFPITISLRRICQFAMPSQHDEMCSFVPLKKLFLIFHLTQPAIVLLLLLQTQLL